MATAILQQTQAMEMFTISIPKVDLKRFKGVAKAMGWAFEKTVRLDPVAEYSEGLELRIERGRNEISNGQCTTCNSKDELHEFLAAL